MANPLDLKDPWLVAAWPGMGAVGLGAVTHLARALGATPIGELATGEFFDVAQLGVKAGVFLPARRPRCWLLGWKAPPGRGRDLALLLGEAQPSGHGWEFAEAVVGAARDLGVTRIVTFAAMATPRDAGAQPRVFAAASDLELKEEAARHDVEPLEEGEISGLNGVLVGAGKQAGIPGLCLLGEFPYFAQAFPQPKASAAILAAFSRLSGIVVDLVPLEEQARAVEDTLREMQEQARDLAARVREDAEDGASEDEDDAGADAATKARIEGLFEAARNDRSKALELKAELDRLGLFREHEDRFLDLFKRGE